MQWRVAMVVAHVDQDDRRQTHHLLVNAPTQTHAADAALDEGLPFEIGENDELLIYVEPYGKPEETGLHIVNDVKGHPQTREGCLKRAGEHAADEGWKTFWTKEADRHKPEAEGGGLTDEAKATQEAEDRKWRERQKSPRRDPA